MKFKSRAKRRQNFIDSHVQGALCKRIFLHWCVFLVVVMLSVVVLQLLLGNPSESISQRLSSQAGQFIFIGIIMFSLLPAFMLDTVRFSNRFVGPFARLRRCMRELAETGETEELRFRDDDFWAEAAAEFNHVRHRLMETKRREESNSEPDTETVEA